MNTLGTRLGAILAATLVFGACEGCEEDAPAPLELPEGPTRLCVGASGVLPYAVDAPGAREVELLVISDETTTPDGSDGIIRTYRAEPDDDGIEVLDELRFTCLDADTITLNIRYTARYGDGRTEVRDFVARVQCVPCDGGMDGGEEPLDAFIPTESGPPPDTGPPGDGGAATPAQGFSGEVIPDRLSDGIDSTGTSAGTADEAVDQEGNGSEREEQSGAEADTDFNDSTYHCGEVLPDRRTYCTSPALPMPAGGLFTFVMDLVAPVPLASPDVSYVYALVLDSDGDPANDFVPLASFPWDSYQGTDRWYELSYQHGSGAWSLTVTQLDATGTRTPVSSTARAVIEGTRVTFFVAAEELPAGVPAYRTTSFRHDGAFTVSTRAVDVPLANPTLSLFAAGCGYTGAECLEANGGLASCGAAHECATESSRGVCLPAELMACGGLLPACPAGTTCMTEGDAIGAPSYCVPDADRSCLCATAAGRHVFPSCG